MECSVCFDDMCAEPCAFFCSGDGKRICPHYFHERCAQELPSRLCPLCRAPFASTMRLPSLTEDGGAAWFCAVDYDGSGRLSKAQVLQVLLTQFPLDVPKFEAKLEEFWPRFDRDGTGHVSHSE